MSYLTQMLGLDRAELRVGGDRHGGARRADPRLRAHARARRRQLLGRSDAQHALRAAAAVDRAGAVPRVAGRRADVRRATRPRSCSTPTDAPPTARHGRRAGRIALGPGRLADRDQAARHQRRRLLQRELGASVREPDAALELPRDARDPADSGGAVLHVRRDGRSDTRQGWARARGDARRSSCRCSSLCVSAEQARQSRAARRSASTRPRARCSPAATWKARRCASASPTRALWATATTAASNGSVNSMHDSFTPLGGLVPMWLIQLGEVDLRRRRLGPLRHARCSRSSRCSSPG